jgi:hypothetical protein
MTIQVTRRTHDWYACIGGMSGCWGCGATPENAVRSVVYAHRDKFFSGTFRIEFMNPTKNVVYYIKDDGTYSTKIK